MFLTKENFNTFVDLYAKKFPKDMHWNANRWEYHKVAVEICKEYSAQKILELGTMGIKIFEGSDEMDFDVEAGWRIEKPTYLHDAKLTPWPIENKSYDFFVALRVFHHLTPFQGICFQEARRIARNIVIVTPENYQVTHLNSKGIKQSEVVDWNMGKEPTRIIDTKHGILYFWDEKALKYV